jgi:hypothetical protein
MINMGDGVARARPGIRRSIRRPAGSRIRLTRIRSGWSLWQRVAGGVQVRFVDGAGEGRDEQGGERDQVLASGS